MKTAKPSAPVIGRRLRRTLGALLAIGFATTWWKFVPTHESAAAPLEKPPATVAESTRSPVIVLPIPIVIPFTLPTAPMPTPPTPKPVQARHRPRIAHTPVVTPETPIAEVPTDQPFAIPPPPEVPTPPEDPPIVDDPPVVVDNTPPVPKTPEPRIRTRSS
jgi:hypothetical protein